MTETLTVTVLETATIFEGPDTVYRYDIMAAGIIEGWAVPAVVDQVRQMGSVHWPDVDVIIDGDEKVTEMLTRTFIGKGVTSYPVDTLREHPLPESTPQTPEEPVVTRPTRGRKHRHFYGIRPLHIALTAVFVGTVAGAWTLLNGDAPSPAVQPATAGTGTAVASISASTTVLIGEGFQVEVPHGYTLSNEGETHMVTGPDPELRIHIGIDPLYGIDPEFVRVEVDRMIADDPALRPAPPGDWAVHGATDYSEDPGDGSQVTWVTWFDADQQISVGCHTRGEPTLIHKASCRNVVDTLTLG